VGLPVSSGAQTPEEIWKGTCQVCHTEPASGAPQVGDKAAWAPRVAKGKEALYRSALGGFSGPKGTEMPARGGNPSLSDAQVKAAVDYMISR
jgi:cytochrome c5